MKDEIIIIADAESDISRFLASFISDEFKVVCCDNSGKTLDDRISTARAFGAINKHHSIILPVETDNCGIYGNWMDVEYAANPTFGIIVVNYDPGFLTTVMNNKDIKKFVLDNMSEIKSHIGLEHLKERLGNNNVKYI